METKLSAALSLTIVLCCCLASSTLSLPTEAKSNEIESADQSSEGRRATWLETRTTLEENFKELVLLAIQELISEGRINPDVAVDKVPEKRGRHQGFCFKKTKSGRFLPYICWKGEDDHDE